MTQINWNLVDKVIYINLASRKDRNVRMVRQLRALGVPKEKVLRFEAIRHERGHIGCTQSHIAVLEMAQDNHWQRILILEDDFAFHEGEANAQHINRYLATLEKVRWQVAFLGAHYHRVTPLQSVDYLVKVDKAWCACAYLVDSDYYATLLHNYRSALFAQLQGVEQHLCALDVHWLRCMQQDLWLGIFPNAGAQQPDRSDIEKQSVDYRHLFNKPLSQLLEPVKYPRSTTGPIKVDFYFQWPPGWTNFESVIDAMRANPAFDCRIVVVPYLNWKATDLRGDIQRQILKERGLKYVGFEDYQLDDRQPDVVFLQNPYDEARPEAFRSEYLVQRGVHIAYIPYALDTGIGEESMIYQYNLQCQNLASWIFARSERHKAEFAIQCRAGNGHVHVTGHPKFDDYDRRYHIDASRPANSVKTFLWTPHFVLPGDQKMYTTFTLYSQAMLRLIEREDIHLIVRPHPLFKQWIGEAAPLAQRHYQQLLEASASRENVTWDTGPDYAASFARSDALIADAGSFLLEYLPSKKPILYLTHESCHGLNRTADFIYNAYDVARREEDIFRFVDNVVQGLDPMRPHRERVLREELHIDETTAGAKIAAIIFSSLRGQ
ncbi:glycosyl transferase [Enterobacteriaceae bacterium 89]|nr:glycosyl transferase [Enterobacteriaceae bacterium 89]